jgi:hypothetical protein
MSRYSANRPQAALFLTAFGTIWLLAWCRLAQIGKGPTLLAIVALALGLASWALWRMQAAHHSGRHAGASQASRRQFRIVNVVQWAAIALLVYGLPRLGYGPWTVPAVMMVVGLHFIPLAAIFGNRAYYLTGALLALWALAYPILLGGPMQPAGCMVTGLILWVHASYALGQRAS